ncbi:Tetratricopeptide repeat-containing protein [Candidatus Kryptobacter tengchongensis]|nr:Tetratricopeptide repeat-containing protein [Candidatus Kryptobacter tengchongensis]
MKRLKSSFLDKVIAVARRYCGDDFIKKFNQIVKEREENFILDLKEAKNKIEVEPEVQEEIVNELKFDTLLSLSAEYLEQYKFIQMCFDIGDVCLTYGEFDKAENCFLLVIKKAGKTREFDEARAKAYVKLGEVKTKQNELNDAVSALKQGLKIYQKLRNTDGIALCENGLGIAFYESGRYDFGTTYFNHALKKAEKTKNEELVARLHINLGIIESMRGNWDKAISHFQQALPRLEKRGDALRLAQTYHNIGITLIHKGEYDAAVKEFDKSIELAQKLEDSYMLALAYLGKADAYVRIKDLPLATAYVTRSLDIFYKIGDRQSIADAYRILGVIQLEHGNLQLAESYFKTSIDLNLEFKNWLNLGETYYELSQLYKKQEQIDKARESLSSSLKYFKKIKVKSYIARIQIELSELKA